jgi:ABC-type proline/glycine betaine transport system substrate-binding protein
VATFKAVPFTLSLVCAVLFATSSGLSKSRDAIRIALSPNTAQNIIAHIVGRTLAEAGFEHEFVKIDQQKIAVISSGEAHFDPFFKVPKLREPLDRAILEERVYSLGGLQSNARDEPALKIIWVGVRNKWPDAEKMFKRMVMPVEKVDIMARSIDAGDATLETVVDTWMAENKNTWKGWISASKNWMKP